MKYYYRFSPLLYLLLFFPQFVFSNPAVNGTNHLLRHVEALSRDYFYLDLSRVDSYYKQQSNVGGEHENHYLLLGFSDDRFKVVIQSE